MLFLTPLAVAVAAQPAGAQTLPCEWCDDLSCVEEDELFWGKVWFPGAIEVSYLGEEGCIYNWGSQCETLMACQNHEHQELSALLDVLSLSQPDAGQALADVVKQAPERFAVIPHRSLLVVLNPGCSVRPVTGIIQLDSAWSSTLQAVAGGVLHGTSKANNSQWAPAP